MNNKKLGKKKNRFWIAVSILIGSCIGAGVLGVPFVASQSGFFVALAYILFLGTIILFANLYLGEISLRTKGNHQLIGYAKKYLGVKGKNLMRFAVIFGIYAAIIAYSLGIGESISYLIFGTSSYTTIFGVFFAVGMSALLWKGMSALKKFEKIGVAIILFLLAMIFILFFNKIETANLIYFNMENLFLPFGVILFALLSFHAIPEIEIVLYKKEKLMKKVLIIGTLVPILFYILFTVIVVGFKGVDSPEIATIGLGTVFIFLGIFAMFTSWLALGNALEENYRFDEKIKRKKAWFYVAILPIILFLIIRFFDFFSFTKILSIGGVISGGLAAILILFMVKKAKVMGNRKPEYSIPINWFVIGFFILVFVFGALREIWLVLR